VTQVTSRAFDWSDPGGVAEASATPPGSELHEGWTDGGERQEEPADLTRNEADGDETLSQTAASRVGLRSLPRGSGGGTGEAPRAVDPRPHAVPRAQDARDVRALLPGKDAVVTSHPGGLEDSPPGGSRAECLGHLLPSSPIRFDDCILNAELTIVSPTGGT
jgi:hypothetical protein